MLDSVNLEQSEWNVTAFNTSVKSMEYGCCPGVKYDSFIGYMQLERRSTFYHWIYTMPAILITCSIFLS